MYTEDRLYFTHNTFCYCKYCFSFHKSTISMTAIPLSGNCTIRIPFDEIFIYIVDDYITESSDTLGFRNFVFITYYKKICRFFVWYIMARNWNLQSTFGPPC